MSIEDEREDIVSEDEVTSAAKMKDEGPARTDPKKKTLVKVIKEDSTLSPAKVVITALTAVSVAIISTKLTTVLNGLTLAALVAVISAILSEAYRIVTALTAHGVERAVLPIEKRNLTDRENESKLEEDFEDEPPRRKPLAVLREYFARRKNMQLVALFTTTAILTIGTSFLVAKSLGEPSLISNNYPTEVRAEQLTEEQKQEIIDKAVSEATDSPTLPAPSDSSSNETPTEEESSSEEPEETSPVEPPTESAQPSESSEAVPPSNSTDDTEVLREEIRKLRERIDELEKNGDTSSTPPAKEDETSEEPSPSEPPKPSSPESSTPESEVTEQDVEELQKQIDDLKEELENREKEPAPEETSEEELSPQPTTSPESAESSDAPQSSEPAPSDGGRS